MSTRRWAEARAEAEFRFRQLDQDLDQTLESNESLTAEVRIQREKVELLEQLLDERTQLLRELHRLEVAEQEATVAVRRAERALSAERAKPPPREGDGRRMRPGRLVRVVADDGAWTALRVEAERTKVRIGVNLARLIEAELANETVRAVAPADRRRRSPGEGRPAPVVHALRVFVTEDIWAQFRIAAAELGLTLGAYLGQLAEAEAHRLGWRPPTATDRERCQS